MTDFPQSPYHAGERALQALAGESAPAARNGAVIASTILAGARHFIAQQPMAVLASVDAAGQPWCSVLYGEHGFAHADGDGSLVLDVPLAQRDPSDALWANVAPGAPLGTLFIEPGSRRRYRINGAIARFDERGLGLRVREAYPNCPKYIQRRQLRRIDGAFAPARLAEGVALDATAIDLVRGADTVFVASSHAASGADASHRGGNAGFLQVLDAGLLRLPDYPGNSMFNTFGNLHLDPRIGLCIPDFAGGRILQLAGHARILHGQPDPQGLSGGSGRFCEIRLERWLLRQAARRMEWEYLDASPFNPAVARA